MAARTIRLHLPKAGQLTEADVVAFATGDSVQICDVTIDNGRVQLPVRLYLSHATSGPTSIDALPAGPSAIPVLVQDGKDELRAVTTLAHASFGQEVAAAVSVMRAAWAWDDRAEFRVRVNDTVHVAIPRHARNRQWEVEVRDGAV